MISFLIFLLIIGIIAGFLARLLVPGPDPMSFWATVLLGIAGSFLGGFLINLVFNRALAITSSGIVGSVLGAIVLLLIARMGRRRRGRV